METSPCKTKTTVHYTSESSVRLVYQRRTCNNRISTSNYTIVEDFCTSNFQLKTVVSLSLLLAKRITFLSVRLPKLIRSWSNQGTTRLYFTVNQNMWSELCPWHSYEIGCSNDFVVDDGEMTTRLFLFTDSCCGRSRTRKLYNLLQSMHIQHSFPFRPRYRSEVDVQVARGCKY